MALLNQNGTITLQEMVNTLKLDERQARRRLEKMEQENLLFRFHGGAMLPSLAEDKPLTSFKGKASKNTSAKQYIARMASGQISEGDTLFMDASSTVFGLCEFFKTKKVKVITNALPIALELSNSSVQVVLLGGELDSERQATFGTATIKQASQYRVRKAFLGTDGISLNYGFSQLTEQSADLSRTFIEQAEEKYILADHSKFNKDSFSPFANIGEITSLFSDQKLDFDLYKQYQQKIDIIK
jgi:DeoR family transcriptional regulator, fructose operon transcriptional repressor